MGLRVDVDSRRRNRLYEEVTAGVLDVVAIPPHVAFANKRLSKSDPPLSAGVISNPVVRENVSANDWGRLGKNYVCSWYEFSQVR